MRGALRVPSSCRQYGTRLEGAPWAIRAASAPHEDMDAPDALLVLARGHDVDLAIGVEVDPAHLALRRDAEKDGLGRGRLALRERAQRRARRHRELVDLAQVDDAFAPVADAVEVLEDD